MASANGLICFGTECPTLVAKTEGQNPVRSCVQHDRKGRAVSTKPLRRAEEPATPQGSGKSS